MYINYTSYIHGTIFSYPCMYIMPQKCLEVEIHISNAKNEIKTMLISA